jgi:hypothetical protein
LVREIAKAVPIFRNKGAGCGLLSSNDGGQLLGGFGKFLEVEDCPE